MTAATSQKLADVLRAAGFERLAVMAEADEFHDFLSPHATPAIYLVSLLQKRGAKGKAIMRRVINGEFDASDAESDEWENSPEGRAAFEMLFKG